MRWTRADSEFYRVVTDAGERLRDGMTRKRVSDAFNTSPEEVDDVGLDENLETVSRKRYKLGNTTQDKPFNDEEVNQARIRAAADAYGRAGRPEEALGLRMKAKQSGLMDVQYKGAQQQLEIGAQQVASGNRAQQRESLADQAMALRRELMGGGDPVEIFQRASQLYGQVPDGRHGSVAEGPDGQPMIVLTDTNNGKSRLAPADAENVGKALDALYSLTSPQAYQAHQQNSRQQQQLDATRQHYERSDANASRVAATQEQYRRDQAPVLAAQAGYYNRMPREAAGPRNHWEVVGTDKDGAPVFMNRTAEDPGSAFRRQDGKPIQDPGFFRRVTGDRPAAAAPKPQALGSTGLIQIGGNLYSQDPTDPRKLVPVQMPGQSLADRYIAASQAPTDGLPSLRSPDTFRRGLPQPQVQYRTDPLSGESITEDEYARKYGAPSPGLGASIGRFFRGGN